MPWYVSTGAFLWNAVIQLDDLGSFDGIGFRITKVGSHSYVDIAQIRINTSAPKGDFFNIVEGIMYDSNDSVIKRVHLAELYIDSEGHASDIKNRPVAPMTVNDLHVHGFLQLEGNRVEIDFGVIVNNDYYVEPLPFGWHWKDCDAKMYILVKGRYEGLAYYVDNPYFRGAKVHVTSEGIVVATAEDAIYADYSGNDMTSGGSGLGAILSAECIVILTNSGRTKNV